MHMDEQFRCLIGSEADLNRFEIENQQIFYCLRILINNEALDIQMNDYAIFEMVFSSQALLLDHMDEKQIPQIALDWVGTLFLKKNSEQQTIHQATLAQSLTYASQFFSGHLHPHFAYFPRLAYSFKRRLVTLNQIKTINHDFYIDDALCFYLPLLIFQEHIKQGIQSNRFSITEAFAVAKEQVFLKDAFGRHLIDFGRKFKKSSILLAKEEQIRLKQVLQVPFNLESLGDLKYLPIISKSWMAEYHLKRLLRLPSHNQLDGYEYEAKLSTQHLIISDRDLPYPILERYQTESIRWYHEEKRIGFRGERASLVIKGEPVMIDGIAKRTEEKTQQLSTWDFHQGLQTQGQTNLLKKSDQPFDQKYLEGIERFEEKSHYPLHLEMRRMKRQLYVLSPKRFFYAVCLDYCTANQWGIEPLLQIEIEYNGQLIFENLIFTDLWWDVDELKKQVNQIEEQSANLSMKLLEISHFDLFQVMMDQFNLLADQAKSLQKQLLLLATFLDDEANQNKIHAVLSNLQDLVKTIQSHFNLLKEKQRFLSNQAQMEIEHEMSVSQAIFDQVEKLVITEMNEIIECLSKRQKVKPSKKTKKKWLKDGLDQILKHLELNEAHHDQQRIDQLLKMKTRIQESDDE
jgi:hypothetical protein